MRVDRELTLRIVRPFKGAGGCLPVLMYHSISDDPEKGVGAYYRVATSPQRFAAQMQWLADAGCRGVSLEEALSAGAGADKLVAITFDDGFRDFHTAAWPVLKQHRFTATMYLPTAFIGSQRRAFFNRECLTWDEVRELRRDGARFGSHTVNHLKLYELPWQKIENELANSRSQIEQELGEKISGFAYPFAFPQEDRNFTQRLQAILKASGYETCATTMIGSLLPGAGSFWVRRQPVNECDDQALFNAKLTGAYDWMASPQAMVRRVKKWTGKTKRRENHS